MGSGVAFAIKQKFPEAYEADRITKKGSEGKLGHYSCAAVDGNHIKRVYNLYTQYNYGRDKRKYVICDAVRNSLTAMKTSLLNSKELDYETIKIGLPKIGSGLGGGDWKVISKIIEDVFLEKTIFVYDLE